MAEAQIKQTMRDFVKAMVEKDVDTALSLCAENATWVTPNGTFKGRAEIRRCLEWTNAKVADQKAVDTGIKIMVQGNIGIYEHIIGGSVDGMGWETLALCVYEFKDGKIESIRTVYDRLAVAQQVAKGFFAKYAVNGVVDKMEEGLH